MVSRMAELMWRASSTTKLSPWVMGCALDCTRLGCAQPTATLQKETGGWRGPTYLRLIATA